MATVDPNEVRTIELERPLATGDDELFYRQIIESIPGMVFTTDVKGSCEYVNEQWLEFTGVPAEQLLGDGWLEALHPEDRARAFDAWQAAVEGRQGYDLEYRVRRHDGTYEWHKVRGRAIRDATGTVVRWLGVAVNVDDLKRAQAAVAARERELQTLADNIPDALCRVDRELRFVFVNAAVAAATGVGLEQSLGKTNEELGMPPELCNLWDSAMRSVFEHGRPESIEFAFETRSGLHHYTGRLVPEHGPDGKIEHVLAITQDVTDVKRAQHALEDAHRRKDEFLAALAHELRNPLAPIRHGLEILRRYDAVDATVARTRTMMERQLSHLVRLVDDLLDVARISRGLVELKPQRLELRTILEHAVEATRPPVDARGHSLTVHVPDSPVWIHGDLTRLAQVVGNLLGNAAKYTPSGGHLELWAGVEGGEAVVRVSDDGIGIAAEMLPRVFDLFAQASRCIDHTQGGLGIGLALCHKLAEMHGGSIVAESPGLDRGSTFTLRLPLAPATDPVADRCDARAEPACSDRRRILVVDDNLDAAETLAMLLELSGHETATTGSGQQALQVARTWQPEIVFLDIGLPGMDGYEVASRLRADPSTAGVMLVAMTGWGAEGDRRRSMDAGFDLHLTKPVGLEVVANVIARLPALRASKDAKQG